MPKVINFEINPSRVKDLKKSEVKSFIFLKSQFLWDLSWEIPIDHLSKFKFQKYSLNISQQLLKNFDQLLKNLQQQLYIF